jgi:hypothetical protein
VESVITLAVVVLLAVIAIKVVTIYDAAISEIAAWALIALIGVLLWPGVVMYMIGDRVSGRMALFLTNKYAALLVSALWWAGAVAAYDAVVGF